MSEPPPRTPPDPSEDETVVDPDWPVRPEGDIVVEQTETESIPPRRRIPTIWPWLLALLLLVLGVLGAVYYLAQDDDEQTATTTAPRTTSELLRVPDVVGTTSSEATAPLPEAGFQANAV